MSVSDQSPASAAEYSGALALPAGNLVLAIAVSAGLAAATASGAGAHGAPPALSASVAKRIVPVAVFGKDDRIKLPAGYEGLKQSIGVLINTRSNSICTAFCVGDQLVATASHCLFRTAGEALPRTADIVFARDKDNPRSQSRIAGHETGSATQHVMSGSMRLSVRPPIEATRDWAVVKLAQPVCRGAVLKIRQMESTAIEREAREGRVFQVAYHRDFENWQLAYSQPCSVRREHEAAPWSTIARDFIEAQHLVLHQCDTGGASSGSPLLVDTANGPEVVGINVGTYVQSKVMIQNGEVVHRSKADAVANTAVNARAFADLLDGFKSAAILPSGAKLKELQDGLKRHGHYAGAIDGTYGPALRSAIESYERAEGMKVSGLASETLLKRVGASQMQSLPPRQPEVALRGQQRRVASRAQTGRHRIADGVSD